MGASKIIYGGEVLIDLTQDTVTEDKLLSGVVAHGADGEQIVGSCTFDTDTKDATATSDEILVNKTAYVKGKKIEGTMPYRGGQSLEITSKNEALDILPGYHDGSGKALLKADAVAQLIPSNIREGVVILGVEGMMTSGEGVNAQTKYATPKVIEQTIYPDTDQGYTHLSSVIVQAIPYKETTNEQGGITIAIG